MSLRARAVVARVIGAPVTVEEITVQAPRPGEVTLRLHACGVCHSDLSATNGTIAYPLPLVLGHEGAGVNRMAVVFGCGGFGLNAIQGCAIAGARMMVAADTAGAKLELAQRLGATHLFNVIGETQVGKAL